MKIKFSSISEQVAEALRGEIEGRTWTHSLPGERQLAARFQVSRKTLRRALGELRAEGLLHTRVNEASFIHHSRRRPATTTRVALLLPTPLNSARPYTTLWINRLMAVLQDRGLYLEILHGTKYFGRQAGRSLARLTATHPARCWILASSTRSLQQWFVDAGIPALVSGSAHEGVLIPSVDVDHRALCRHAASVLLRAGHRRVALFLDRTGRAGDAESELGFHEGVRAFGGEVKVTAGSPGSAQSTEATIRQIKKLLALENPPTGWLLSNSHSYLTTLSYLGSAGLKVPQDISLICRDEEPFMQFLHPSPARYATSPARFATRLAQALRRIEGGDSTPFSLRIMPDYLAGASVSRRTLV